jgi:hypothetical protein
LEIRQEDRSRVEPKFRQVEVAAIRGMRTALGYVNYCY